MSDFFGGLKGHIEQPDVVMNRGPLPPTSSAGMPPGFNGVPDGEIDMASSLLGDLQPYAYGQAARPGSQAGYQNIPHAVARIIPAINIPEPQRYGGDGFFLLNHQVDDGDISFVIRAMFSPFNLVDSKQRLNRQGMLYAVDPVVNLATLNYILHGLQRYGYEVPAGQNNSDDRHTRAPWRTLWMAMNLDSYFSSNFQKKLYVQSRSNVSQSDGSDNSNKSLAIRAMRYSIAEHVIRHCITPFGVPRGSEKQGGQHQGVNFKSVTWPVDFVTSNLIDGKCQNLANYWRRDDINAGDDLMLFLQDVPTTEYVLSSNPRSMRKLTYPPLGKVRYAENHLFAEDLSGPHGANITHEQAGEKLHSTATEAHVLLRKLLKNQEDGLSDILMTSQLPREACMRPGNTDEPIFQLVPGVNSSCRPEVVNAIWRQGYWHIARSQVMQFAFQGNIPIHSGAQFLTNGKLLEATFSPVWTEPLGSKSYGRTVANHVSAPDEGERPRLGKRLRESDDNDDPENWGSNLMDAKELQKSLYFWRWVSDMSRTSLSDDQEEGSQDKLKKTIKERFESSNNFWKGWEKEYRKWDKNQKEKTGTDQRDRRALDTEKQLMGKFKTRFNVANLQEKYTAWFPDDDYVFDETSVKEAEKTSRQIQPVTVAQLQNEVPVMMAQIPNQVEGWLSSTSASATQAMPPTTSAAASGVQQVVAPTKQAQQGEPAQQKPPKANTQKSAQSKRTEPPPATPQAEDTVANGTLFKRITAKLQIPNDPS